MDQPHIEEGIVNAQHTTEHVPTATRSAILRRCRSRQAQPLPSNNEYQPNARPIHATAEPATTLQLYKVQETVTEPAPKITVQISSSTGTRNLNILPDSEADISAAGQEVLEYLGQHVDNILPSRTVNGLSMIPLGKVPVTIKLGKQTYQDGLHIYPGVPGALISWKAARIWAYCLQATHIQIIHSAWVHN